MKIKFEERFQNLENENKEIKVQLQNIVESLKKTSLDESSTSVIQPETDSVEVFHNRSESEYFNPLVYRLFFFV